MFSRWMSVAAVFAVLAAALLAFTASPRQAGRASVSVAPQVAVAELAPVLVTSRRGLQ